MGFLIVGTAIVLALVSLAYEAWNRPDRVLARRIEECARRIRSSAQEIADAKAKLPHLVSEAHLAQMRERGATHVGLHGKRLVVIEARSEADFRVMRDMQVKAIEGEIRFHEWRLDEAAAEWRELVRRHHAQQRLLQEIEGRKATMPYRSAAPRLTAVPEITAVNALLKRLGYEVPDA